MAVLRGRPAAPRRDAGARPGLRALPDDLAEARRRAAPRILERELPELEPLALAWLLEQDGELFAATGGRAARWRCGSGKDRGGRRGGDFKPSPQVATLRERILDFIDDNVYPQERQIMEGLDAEVAERRPRPRRSLSTSARRPGRRASGTCSCPTSASGWALPTGVRPALRGDGPQPRGGSDGLQLLGAGHRQHPASSPSTAPTSSAKRWLEPLLVAGSAPASR